MALRSQTGSYASRLALLLDTADSAAIYPFGLWPRIIVNCGFEVICSMSAVAGRSSWSALIPYSKAYSIKLHLIGRKSRLTWQNVFMMPYCVINKEVSTCFLQVMMHWRGPKRLSWPYLKWNLHHQRQSSWSLKCQTLGIDLAEILDMLPHTLKG